MNCDSIYQLANKIKNEYYCNDFKMLCKSLGILLLSESMGCSEESVKGIAFSTNNVNAIIINSDLPNVVQRVIIAHEIGHILLHIPNGKASFCDNQLLNSFSLYEKEANIFAANLLIDDYSLIEYLKDGYAINLAAAYFKVPIELIEYKIITLKDIGENFSNSIETPLSSCLANIPIADLIF